MSTTIFLVKNRGKTKCDKYAAFQIHWLLRIQGIVSYREYTTEEGQENDELMKGELAIADVSNLILQDFDTLSNKNDILLLFLDMQVFINSPEYFPLRVQMM